MVGADGLVARELACALFEEVVNQVVAVSSMAAAEATKITENVFRAVNIALANELKMIFACMAIDTWEVIDAAGSKPFGYMPFYPGPGTGGHCIPVDPIYLIHKAQCFGVPAKLIKIADQINTSMPKYLIDRLIDALNIRFRKPLNQCEILIVGITYKKNVSDIRDSPGVRVMEMLLTMGARVFFFDPHISAIPCMPEYPTTSGRNSIKWEEALLAQFDAAVIITDHDCIDYGALVSSIKLVVDCRNATRYVKDRRDRILQA